jgi:signal transduction histidine kinase
MFTLSTLIVAVVWMLLLGLGFHALLRRYLQLDDELARKETALAEERHARSSAERALANTHITLCKLARQQEAVREAERQRIGRDIHDDLGQNLLALKIDLSLLHVSTSGAHPMITRKVDSMMGNLDTTIRSLRAVINDLRPLALEAGLQAAILWQLSEFTRLNGIAHVLRFEPALLDAAPEPERDATVYRILQESLCNVARHAHASEVKVALERSGSLLTLSVQDNGIGMAADRQHSGSGLAGMRDRVAAIGGKLSIDSQAGSGTLLSVSFPVPQGCAAHSV